MAFRVTYATLQADSDEIHAAFASGLADVEQSAASRVYVEQPVAEAFTEALVARAAAIEPADPRLRTTFLGPVIDAAAVARYERAVAEAGAAGAVLTGGERCRDDERVSGYFVQPAVVTVPPDSWIWSTELFVPLVAVRPVADLDAAIDAANDTELGLTAGFFSVHHGEIDHFLERIQAGVVYVNRRAGATTGAWPGVQPFGGWKGSGTAGKSGGGPYYLQQYLREQSRTIVEA